MKLALCLLLFFMSFTLAAQTVQRESLGMSGGAVSLENEEVRYRVSQSVGQQSVIGSAVSSEGIVVRQGFQQPPILVVALPQSETAIEATVFPNPVKSSITIAFNEVLEGKLVIVVHDMLGRSVLQREPSASKKVTLNLSSLTSGTYLLTVNSEGRAFTTRLIKN